VEGAIEFEIKRQIELIEKGEKVIQETRGWDEVKGKTFSQRVKESANDYRYFPDPDLPKLSVTMSEEFSHSRLNEELPQLPLEKRVKYKDLGLSREQSEILVSDFRLGTFFDSVLMHTGSDADVAKLVSNYLTSDLLPLFEERGFEAVTNSRTFSELMCMVAKDEISSRVAKDLLVEVVFEGKDPRDLATQRNLLQSSSVEDLYPLVDEIIRNHESVVLEYRAGKETALQFLVGQGMKLSKGSANPKMLLDLFKKRLS
jgi:aspartyl-tRNA(Asn)/glutamyl-tRNA(Gln) amidotransferase subunit B